MYISDFNCDFRKVQFLSHLGKYFIKIEKISAKNTCNWENKGHFWIGNDSHIRRKNGQIKSLNMYEAFHNV